jgi:hypothetical protein
MEQLGANETDAVARRWNVVVRGTDVDAHGERDAAL